MKGALAAVLLLVGCGTFRAGEATIAESKAVRVKLVRYYERMPLDYTGYKYDVVCNDQKLGMRSTEFADYNDNSPQAMAARLRQRRITITPDDVVIWIEPSYILFAFDRCRQQVPWWPPAEMREVHYRSVEAHANGAVSFIAEGQGGAAVRVTREGKGWRQEPMK